MSWNPLVSDETVPPLRPLLPDSSTRGDSDGGRRAVRWPAASACPNVLLWKDLYSFLNPSVLTWRKYPWGSGRMIDSRPTPLAVHRDGGLYQRILRALGWHVGVQMEQKVITRTHTCTHTTENSLEGSSQPALALPLVFPAMSSLSQTRLRSPSFRNPPGNKASARSSGRLSWTKASLMARIRGSVGWVRLLCFIRICHMRTKRVDIQGSIQGSTQSIK